ncbi:type I phosphodiesterase/nucleotide pyrophosphatase family protein [Heterostelium album PN500]|uniref:Type I phosphodiesterase/nucleotide pyrophosphatase family protein n=1 Tax=Heterostelium pallidum (strain ATCC 26659 / Pp 5 / PN500) TaxID=670386 RepID=D3B9I9_HETP5|nr:type I phosphodiesterase/nucleotide pyrophosphatase family protein [Heterostelium album PN500]EFA81901.1 type I phosphodiesterase/nucleotide pyrophosphatase family protein [Heterostelium album PN500]|eukprot:XP_020434018.1 type I phosphodiesterase/nucleotide pyrophosphatase family protein [Heterostelium album PN500]
MLNNSNSNNNNHSYDYNGNNNSNSSSGGNGTNNNNINNSNSINNGDGYEMNDFEASRNPFFFSGGEFSPTYSSSILDDYDDEEEDKEDHSFIEVEFLRSPSSRKSSTITYLLNKLSQKRVRMALYTLLIMLVVFVIFFSVFFVLRSHIKDNNDNHVKPPIYNTPRVNPTIVISIDGFRYDYLEWGLTPNIMSLYTGDDAGVRADYMTPQFPSKTFPNHYSIATGLYPENHGIVSNTFYDPVLNETFSRSLTDKKWWWGEPIWESASKSNLNASCYFWPGCAAYVPQYNVSPFKPTPASTVLAQVLSWQLNQKPNLTMAYLYDVDNAAHQTKGGVKSLVVNNTIVEVDNAIGTLLQGLKDNGLYETTNIIILSDHGMTNIIETVDVTQYIDMTATYVPDTTPILSVYENQVGGPQLKEANLPHLNVYLKDEIPDAYRYNSTTRIAPLIAVVDEGYQIILDGSKSYVDYGEHGYNNTLVDMRAIFVAHGPNIVNGKKNFNMPNTEVYNFIAQLMNVTKPAPNNGTSFLVDLIYKPNKPYLSDNDDTKINLFNCNINYLDHIVKQQQQQQYRDQSTTSISYLPWYIDNRYSLFKLKFDNQSFKEILDLLKSNNNNNTLPIDINQLYTPQFSFFLSNNDSSLFSNDNNNNNDITYQIKTITSIDNVINQRLRLNNRYSGVCAHSKANLLTITNQLEIPLKLKFESNIKDIQWNHNNYQCLLIITRNQIKVIEWIDITLNINNYKIVEYKVDNSDNNNDTTINSDTYSFSTIQWCSNDYFIVTDDINIFINNNNNNNDNISLDSLSLSKSNNNNNNNNKSLISILKENNNEDNNNNITTIPNFNRQSQTSLISSMFMIPNDTQNQQPQQLNIINNNNSNEDDKDNDNPKKEQEQQQQQQQSLKSKLYIFRHSNSDNNNNNLSLQTELVSDYKVIDLITFDVKTSTLAIASNQSNQISLYSFACANVNNNNNNLITFQSTITINDSNELPKQQTTSSSTSPIRIKGIQSNDNGIIFILRAIKAESNYNKPNISISSSLKSDYKDLSLLSLSLLNNNNNNQNNNNINNYELLTKIFAKLEKIEILINDQSSRIDRIESKLSTLDNLKK